MRIAGLAAIVVFTLWASPRTPAQTEPVFRSNSEVVLVPATVLDKHGRAVSGLKREDFELRVDGKPVRITALDEINAPPPALVPPALPENTVTNLSPVAASRSSWTVLLVDLINTSIPERMELRKQLMKFLSQDLKPGQQLAIYALSGSLVLVHPFTADTKPLIEAASRLLHEKGAPSPVDGFISAAPASIAGSIGVSSGGVSSVRPAAGTPTGSRGAGKSDIENFLLASQWREAVYTSHTRAANTLAQFRQLANAFAGVAGKKTVLWLTGDASPLNPTLMYQMLLSDPSLEPLRLDWRDLASTYEALNGAGISVFPVDIRGITNPGLQGPAEHTSHPDFMQTLALNQQGESDPYPSATSRREGEAANAVLAMQTAAVETGGRVLRGSNDISELIGRAQDLWSSYYVLAFTPEPGAQTKYAVYHRIDVKAPGRRAEVLFRHGYVARPESIIASDDEIKRDLVDAAASPVDLTGVPLTLKSTPSGFLLTIPGQALERTGDVQNPHFNFSIFILLKDSKGKVISTMGDRIDRAFTAAEAASIAKTGFAYPGKFDAPAGDRTFGRIVVRDNLNGHTGTLTLQITRD